MAPRIETQPNSVGTTVGGGATFTLVASGEELIYQWFGPGGVLLINTPGKIAGVTSATLQIFNTQFEDFGDYRVRITNAEAFVDSDVAILFQSRSLWCTLSCMAIRMINNIT